MNTMNGPLVRFPKQFAGQDLATRLTKLARLEFVRRAGPEAYALLEGIERDGINMILPPGGVTE